MTNWEHPPQTPKEFFNMKHSSCRNVIERAFGLLKGRWAILRGKSFYPIKTQCKIIVACCLLHNFIKRENEQYFDQPFDYEDENNIDNGHDGDSGSDDDDAEEDQHYTYINSSNTWKAWRDSLAQDMFDQWRRNRRA